MSERIFYETTLTMAPIPNQRGRLTRHYIIAVSTHDPDGKPYDDLIRRAKDAFNAAIPGRDAFQPVDLTEIDEREVQKKKLEQIFMRHESAVHLVKNE